MILRRLILTPRFHTVVTMAKGLPVAPVPEELLVTTMRNDVIDIRCLHEPSFLHALHTQRVRLKILLPGLAPSSSVTSSGSGPYLFRMLSRMFIAVFPSPWHKPGTARVSTGVIRCSCHPIFLPSKKAPRTALSVRLSSFSLIILYHKCKVFISVQNGSIFRCRSCFPEGLHFQVLTYGDA